MSSKTNSPLPPKSTSDWSPDQYLLFRQARDRPIRDLIAFLGPDYAPKRITDLGCGPGTSTALLAARFPSAHLTGVDSSPAMIARARTEALPPGVVASFAQADVRTYLPDPDPLRTTDLLFSNAVFHWLRTPERLPAITRLLRTLQKGGVLALQMPDNYDEPSHRAMREAAAAPGPWQSYFADLPPDKRPDLDPIEPVMAYYDALRPNCSEVEVWTTEYVHVLEDHGGIVEWVKGTGLQPFVNALPEEGEVREGFLREYRRRLEEGYPKAGDGRVLLRYPRRFVVAVR